MNQGKIPTIIGIVVLLFGIGLGVYLIQYKNIFKLGAEADVFPKDVRITNITDSSFTVSWTTDKEVQGFVSWGGSENKVNMVEEDELEGKGFTHSVTIRGLNESTDYFFKINSSGVAYDNNGVPWQITTGVSLANLFSSNTISGTVLTQTGESAKNALVYITVGDASPLSTVTSESGNWVINLSLLRKGNLSSFFSLSPTTDVIEISVNAGPKGTTSAQIYLQSAKPTPPMILGTTHNFKNSPASQTDGELPELSLDLPQQASKESKFNIDETQKPNINSKSVTIESIDEGEVISTEKPQFFGDGPAGETITITIESEVITANIKVGSTGNWSWSPPQNLVPGAHKITISYRDANGILQSISRTFIVQASEVPAFEATPSATPTQTPAPTATPIPTPTKSSSPTPTPRFSPTATATSSATPTARATSSPRVTTTPTSTAIPIPESGTSLPSILLLALGVILITTGFGLGSYAILHK